MNIIRKITNFVLIFVAIGGFILPIHAQNSPESIRQELIAQINQARQLNGRAPLIPDDQLNTVTQLSIEQAASADDINRVSVASIDALMKATGYEYANFWFINRTPVRDVSSVVANWMLSEDVRLELLSEIYDQIGTGYAENQFGDGYLMLILGKRGGAALPSTMPAPCPNPVKSYLIPGQDLTPPQSPERANRLRTLTNLYDSLIPTWLNNAVVPGAVIGLIDNGDLVWVNAYGYRDGSTYARMTTDTVFDVASLSKPITSTAILQLYEYGQVELNMPVFDTLITWQPDTRYDLRLVTPYRLLSHTAGFPTANYPLFWENFEPVPTLVDTLNGIGYRRNNPVTLVTVPGTTFAYSNAGYSVLQLLIEAISGQSFADYTRCNVLLPLGMTMSDFYFRPDLQAMHAMGHDDKGNPLGRFTLTPAQAPAGLHTTVPDFGRWVVAVLASPNIPNILASETFNLMLMPAEGTDDEYGLGMYLTTWEGEMMHGHNGITTGFRAIFQLIPEKRHAIIVFTNSWNGDYFYNRVVGQWFQWLKSTGEIQGLPAEVLEANRQANITHLIDLINQERLTANLQPLSINTLVMQEAQTNSQMMAGRDDVEWHQMGDFVNRMASLNYFFDYYYYWGAFGFQLDAQGALDIWKANTADFDLVFMNENATEIGIGLSTSGGGMNYYAVFVVHR